MATRKPNAVNMSRKEDADFRDLRVRKGGEAAGNPYRLGIWLEESQKIM